MRATPVPLIGCALLISTLSLQASAQARLPIIDMHLHARKADYIGTNPPPMCAPFEVMPRWDPRSRSTWAWSSTEPPCKAPIFPARTDEQVMQDTLAVMDKRNIIGMVSGEPEMMAVWKARPRRESSSGCDLRISARKPARC